MTPEDWRRLKRDLDIMTMEVFVAMVAVTASLLLLLAVATATRAHEFYPWECCSDRDCWATGPGEREADPVFTRQGWRLADGVIVPFNQTRPSPDGRFHVCRQGGAPAGALIRPPQKLPCLWAPMGGS